MSPGAFAVVEICVRRLEYIPKHLTTKRTREVAMDLYK